MRRRQACSEMLLSKDSFVTVIAFHILTTYNNETKNMEPYIGVMDTAVHDVMVRWIDIDR